MVGRYDLTDFEWSIIKPLLPNKSRGVKRVDDRKTLNGTFWKLRSGAPWRDIPERYGSNYKRNVIERCFGRLKHFRFISTRYEKHPENFLAFIKLAIIRIQLRYYES